MSVNLNIDLVEVFAYKRNCVFPHTKDDDWNVTGKKMWMFLDHQIILFTHKISKITRFVLKQLAHIDILRWVSVISQFIFFTAACNCTDREYWCCLKNTLDYMENSP